MKSIDRSIESILIILLISIFLTQTLPINVAVGNTEETDGYYIKIVNVAPTPSAALIGEPVTYKVEIEYNLRTKHHDWQIIVGQEWVVEYVDQYGATKKFTVSAGSSKIWVKWKEGEGDNSKGTVTLELPTDLSQWELFGYDPQDVVSVIFEAEADTAKHRRDLFPGDYEDRLEFPIELAPADELSIESISPIEGTEFSPSQEVTFKASIRYKLTSKSTGKIYLQAFDQKDSVDIGLGSGTVQLEVSCKVPIKTSLTEETSTVDVVAFLLPEGASSPEVYDTKEFVIRNIRPLVAVASKAITALYPDGLSETIPPNQNFDITPGTKVTLRDGTTLLTPVEAFSVDNGAAEIEYKSVPVLRAITLEEKERSEIFERRVKIIKQEMENVPVLVKTFDLFLPVSVVEPFRYASLKVEEKKLWGWKETFWEDEETLFYEELAGWYWDHKYDLAKGYIAGKVLGHFKTIKKLPSTLQNFISNVLADEEIRKRFLESSPDGSPSGTAFSSFGHRSSLLTPAGTVIHQTNFMFEVLEDGTTTLAVIEGEAEFMDINQTKIVTVNAGQSSTIKPGSAPSNPSPFADDDGNGYPDALESWETIEIGITLSEHTLCLDVGSEGNPIEEKTVFTDDEKVVSWLSVVNASVGDEVIWVFEGPNNITETYSLVSEEGEGYCYALLDLQNYDSESVVGDWTVTVYLNGEQALTQQFKVEETTEELSAPDTLIGLIILAVPVVIIAALIRHLIKRRGKK